jgi:DNA-binding transcriptional LysR family regulator
MMDWDDVRYFLAVAREGSVRAAAERLRVNHSTVLRRISHLEERLGVQMFERLPSGYSITAAGEEVLEFAEQMEASSFQLETRVFGRDQGAHGLLRVTVPPFFATHLLMRDFADFSNGYPDIEVEIISSGEVANLTTREADVAIRIIADRKTLPLNLHGRKGPDVYGGIHLSGALLAGWRAGNVNAVRPIVIGGDDVPDWARDCNIDIADVHFRTPGAETQLAAAREGIGITRLPCFVGDADPSLIRAPGSIPRMGGALWLLSQGETRKTKRVRLFIDFISRRVASYAPMLAGLTKLAD